MISMNVLGNKGRLGNQIFQFAFLYGLHKAKKYDFCLPPNTDLLKCFDISAKIIKTGNKTEREKYFHFDNQFPISYKDNVDYDGYYQSEKYFKHCKEDLISALSFKSEHKVPFQHTTDSLVSIHIRRGDYVGNPHHPLISMDYINKAKSLFSNKKFLVFSDDIRWCKTNNLGDFYSDGNSHYIDLYQMSQCSGAIIANSSFSWWGAYLGRKKEKVVAPMNWFSGANSNLNVSDVYCQDWVII